MNRRFWGMLAVAACFFAVCISPCCAAGTTPSEAAKTVSKFLTSEGYVPKYDEDGDIEFKIEGRTYLVIFDEEDGAFFSVMYPSFWESESPAETQRAKEVIVEVNGTVKVARLNITKTNRVYVIVDLFCEDANALTKVLKRAISAIQLVKSRFVNKMQQE